MIRSFVFRYGLALLFTLSLLPPMKGQELNCNVQVVSQQIQGTNKSVFTTLQRAIYEFMNNTVWSNHVYNFNERIECNLLINLTEQLSADEFKGTIQVQIRRQAYNTTFYSSLINYVDNSFHIRYVEFEPLEFDPTRHSSNLTSILAYYAYMILGFDYDSYSPEGGTPFFEAAEAIVNNAQNAPESGWKPYDGSRYRNRYWLVTNVLKDEYRDVRNFYYAYHRLALDIMEKDVNEGRAQAAESLVYLRDVFRAKPDPYMHLLQLIFDVKSDEWVEIFQKSFPEEKRRVLEILNEIDPANRDKYRKIQEAS